MAINPLLLYPSQTIASDSGWPFGKPRNVGVPGDRTGTPLEAAWVSDTWGFQQSILDAAGVTPNGQPDSADNIQYLEALFFLFQRIDAFFSEVRFAAEARFEGGARFVGVGIRVEGAGNVFTGATRFQAPTTFTVGPTFQQGALFQGLVASQGPIAAQGGLAVTGGVFTVTAPAGNSIQGEIEFRKPIRQNAAIAKKTLYVPNADNTYIDFDTGFSPLVVFRDGVITAAWNIRLEDATYDGVEIEFLNWSSYIHTIRTPGDSIIPGASVPGSPGPNIPGRLKLCWYSPDASLPRWTVA
jgi:hypothetical protein